MASFLIERFLPDGSVKREIMQGNEHAVNRKLTGITDTTDVYKVVRIPHLCIGRSNATENRELLECYMRTK